MAKNLQTVLNSVVNDLLQEDDGGAGQNEYMRALATPGVDPDKYNPTLWAQKMDSAAKVQDAINRAEALEYYKANAPRGVVVHDPGQVAADIQGVQDKINAIEGSPINRVKSGWEDAKEWMGQNPLATAGIGTGLGAALAAGAGALYLRKKQREANRAAGR